MVSVAEYLIQQMQSFGALLLNHEQTEKLRAICLPDGSANKKLVGKSPSALAGSSRPPLPAKAPRLLIAVVDADDSWVTCEQLMPMLPIVKVNDFDSALAPALKVEDGLHHTAIMHSQNVSRLNLAARVMQTSIFVKNGPSGRVLASAAKALRPLPLQHRPERVQRQHGLLPAHDAAC